MENENQPYPGELTWHKIETPSWYSNEDQQHLQLRRGNVLRADLTWNEGAKYYHLVMPNSGSGVINGSLDLDAAKQEVERRVIEHEQRVAANRGKPETLDTRITYLLDYSDLDDFVQREYGRFDFNSVADYEWDNGHSVITAADPYSIGEDGEKELKLFIAGSVLDGEYPPSLSTLLSDLARKGIIPEGRYLVSVTW